MKATFVYTPEFNRLAEGLLTDVEPDALTVGDSIIKGLEEALAYEREELPLRTRTVERTARQARVVAPPVYDSARIRVIRARLALSQPLFAAALNVSPQTVKAWERGARVPEGPTRRLLELTEEHPDALLAKVHA